MREGVDYEGKIWKERVLRKGSPDYTNLKYGHIVVLLPINYWHKSGSKETGWLCKCTNCSRQLCIDTNSITKQRSKSCPSCATSLRFLAKAQEHIGEQIGFLKIIDVAGASFKKIQYKCQCVQCGKESLATYFELTSGRRNCATCSIRARFDQKREDLTKQKFGMLQPIEYEGYKNHRAYWKCQCDCGKTISVREHDLKTGNTRSCGCIKSKGERNIFNILNENKISFLSQYSPPISTQRQGRVFYDFALLNELSEVIRLIEFDGEQHFSNTFNYSEENYQYYLSLDTLKNQYAFEHNIPLVRIPYKERDNITLELLLGDKYLLHSPS